MVNRKKIDNRVRLLIENGVSQGRRSMFVVVGDKARDQVLFNSFGKNFIDNNSLLRLLFFTTCYQKPQ